MPYMLHGTTVVKADGSPVPGGQHTTRAQAIAHLRALDTNVADAKVESQRQGPLSKAARRLRDQNLARLER